jgi:hypothetical protein
MIAEQNPRRATAGVSPKEASYDRSFLCLLAVWRERGSVLASGVLGKRDKAQTAAAANRGSNPVAPSQTEDEAKDGRRNSTRSSKA